MADRVKLAENAKAPAKRKDEAVEAAPMPAFGRPSKYDPEVFPRTAKFMAQRGAIQSEIADCLGVTTRTLQNWIVQFPEMQEAISVGVEAFNTRVERSLAECATGFWVTWEEQVVVGLGDKERIEVVTRRKYYPPNTTAQIFFLKNRMADRYRDVQEHRVQGELPTAAELMEGLKERILKLNSDGLLTLPAPRKMKEINPKANGHSNGHG